MFIDNHLFTTKSKCDDCAHGGVCKHRENYNAIMEKAKEIDDDISPKMLSPISVEVKCRSFESKPIARNGYCLSDLKRDIK